jgi:hypothetical protein
LLIEETQWAFFIFGKFLSGVEIVPKKLAVQKCGDEPRRGDFEKNFCCTHKNALSHS